MDFGTHGNMFFIVMVINANYARVLCFIMGRRATGYFKLRTITGGKVHDSVSYKKIEYVGRSSGYMYDYIVH